MFIPVILFIFSMQIADVFIYISLGFMIGSYVIMIITSSCLFKYYDDFKNEISSNFKNEPKIDQKINKIFRLIICSTFIGFFTYNNLFKNIKESFNLKHKYETNVISLNNDNNNFRPDPQNIKNMNDFDNLNKYEITNKLNNEKSSNNIRDKILELNNLKNSGVITQEEYNDARKSILSSI